jgi:hypothetical protein
VSADEVLAAPMLMPGVMTRLMACPPTCGAAAAILVSEAFARRHGLDASVTIAAQAMTTDTPSTFAAHDMMQLVGYDMAKAAARHVYDVAGIGPEDVDVVELHDCFEQNELITYEALVCAPRAVRRSSSPRATTPTAGATSPTPPAGCCRRDIRLGQRDSRSATNSRSSCAAPRPGGR